MDYVNIGALSIVAILLFFGIVYHSWMLCLIGIGLFATIFFLQRRRLFQSYYKFEDSKINDLKYKIGSVIPEIHQVKLFGSNESFTVDKRTSYICVKDKEGNYYSDNMLTYVILHELAHALCDEVNPPGEEHTPKWENIFNQLLKRAEAGGLYDPSIPVVRDYCGY